MSNLWKSKTKPVRSYGTHFARDENPISESGMWLNGRRDGLDWTDVIVKNGVAYGDVSGIRWGGVAERRIEQGNIDPSAPPVGDYDDPQAILAGHWGKNQHITAKVFSRDPTDKYFQEIELRLRSTMMPHGIPGYEIIFRPLKTEKGYLEIVRWEGKLGAFFSLKRLNGAGVQDGDVVEGTIEGNMIKGYINGVEMISTTDDTYTSGAPGFGFNYGVGNSNVDHGIRYFYTETYDD